MKINVGFDRREDPKRYDRIWRRKYNRMTGNVKRKLADYRYIDRRAGFDPICDYTYDELLYLLSTQKCKYCRSSDRLGLDRIDNSKGHTKDNTVVACYICNTVRSNKYSSEEMKRIKPLLDRIKSLNAEIDRLRSKIGEIIDRKG